MFENYGQYFLFFCAITFPYSMLAHLSCCFSNIKLCLGISGFGECRADIFLEPPEEAEKYGEELKAPRPPQRLG